MQKINSNIQSMCWVPVHVLVYVNELYKWQWPQWFCGRWSWNQRIYFEKKKKHLLVFSLEDYEFKLDCCQHWLLTQSLYGRCRVVCIGIVQIEGLYWSLVLFDRLNVNRDRDLHRLICQGRPSACLTWLLVGLAEGLVFHCQTV